MYIMCYAAVMFRFTDNTCILNFPHPRQGALSVRTWPVHLPEYHQSPWRRDIRALHGGRRHCVPFHDVRRRSFRIIQHKPAHGLDFQIWYVIV